MSNATVHEAVDGIHSGTFQSCVLCFGAKPCVAHEKCTGMFHPDWKEMDYTGWRYLSDEGDVLAHDCRTE